MAISKKLFDELNIENKWRKGISDDLILSKAVKDAGYKIKFVPECIVGNYGDYGEESIRKFVKWSTGQFTLLRWYYPSLWIISFIGMVGLKFLNLLGGVPRNLVAQRVKIPPVPFTRIGAEANSGRVSLVRGNLKSLRQSSARSGSEPAVGYAMQRGPALAKLKDRRDRCTNQVGNWRK